MEKSVRRLPIFKKAEEIRQLTMALVETLRQDILTEVLAEQMVADAMIIPAKIFGAESGADEDAPLPYSLKMENAVIIKIAARELRARLALLDAEDMAVDSYTQLLRTAIDEFRELFLEWIDGFDPNENSDDGWGIFV